MTKTSVPMRTGTPFYLFPVQAADSAVDCHDDEGHKVFDTSIEKL